MLAHLLAIAGAGVVIAVTDADDHWSLGTLAVIATFCVLSDLMSVKGGTRVLISGSFLGIVLATVTLGGGPGAALGVLTIVVGWFRSREVLHSLASNVANYAWFPLLTGLLFHTASAGMHDRTIAFYLLVFAAFVVGLALNFVGAVGYSAYLERAPLLPKVRDVLIPVLPAELFSALLTVGAINVYIRLGTSGLVFCSLVFVIFQYLVGELLKSQRRGVALRRAATTDELTGLANRERFRAVVEKRIAAARASGSRFVVMLVDLDHFKEINDALGHHCGDALLRDLGPRLAAAVEPDGLVARLGGDEFAILLGEDTDDPAALDAFLRRLIALIGEPFVIEELSLEVGASVGVSRFPQDGEDAHALLQCADIAMYSAKEAQTDYRLYAADQNHHSVRRLSVLSDIRHALTSDQIVVHFQPIVDVDDMTVRGAEGLVRWLHPEHGLIPPADFVQIVEQTGLIGPLTRNVLEQAIAQCAVWRLEGRDLSVAVNLSVRNLLDRELPQQVAALLHKYRLPPEALQLEITESMIMSDPERATATVTRLSALGVRLSVDDFGTGYSSFANLRKLPINELKIDRSFVAPMLQEENDLIIVRSTINLGHDLGLRIIAEGVEDRPTLERLALLGCDLAQGYHVSRPMPPDAFTDWLREADAREDLATPGLRLPLAAGG